MKSASEGLNPEDLAIGDLVQLTSGGPVMSVAAPLERDGRLPVMWFRDSELMNAKIPLGALERGAARAED